MLHPSLYPRPGPIRTPRDFLKHAEDYAVRIRKLLADIRPSSRGSESRPSRDDAFAIASLIEELSSKGKRADAAEAVDIADRVELLIDALWAEIDAILAS